MSKIPRLRFYEKVMLIHEEFENQIKPSLYSRYYAEACNEWPGPPPRHGAGATQLRRDGVAAASRWRYCVLFYRPGNRT